MDTEKESNSAGISANTSAEQVTAYAGGHGDSNGLSRRVASGHTPMIEMGAGFNRARATAIAGTNIGQSPLETWFLAEPFRERANTDGSLSQVQRLRMNYEHVIDNGGHKTPSSGKSLENPNNSPNMEFILKMRKEEEDALSKCGNVLRKMQLATQKQRNISLDVKEGISKLEEYFCVILTSRESWQRAEKLQRERMTANIAKTGSNSGQTPTSSRNKRNATSPPLKSTQNKKVRDQSSAQTHDTPIAAQFKTPQQAETGNGKINEVQRNKRNKDSKRRRGNRSISKPEALLIKPTEGHSYAEVLKNLRTHVQPDEHVKIKGIRKTKTGALLVEFDKGEKADPALCEKLKSTLKHTASVFSSKQMTTVAIRNLDSCTEKEEVLNAVKGIVPEAESDLRISITSPNNREQVQAFVTLPEDSARILLKAEVIKIGWLRVRLRRWETIKKCYKCFGAGHTQLNCNGPNRKAEGLCFRCGETGHRLKQCINRPKCWNCIDAKHEPTDHIPGSSKCPMQNSRKTTKKL